MVSDDLKRALDELKAQVHEATRRLLKLPGSRHEDCAVPLDDDGVEWLEFREFMDEQTGHDYESIAYIRNWPNADDVAIPFFELPISKRVKLAVQIPELLKLANQCSDKLTLDARGAAGVLKQALADQS